MKISIIVPVYNISHYVQDCIDSILSQSFCDYEILLIDDGSTDESSSLCDKIAETDDRIQVYHKLNRGLSTARNYGVERASGEYLFFVDGDDFLPQGALQRIADCLQSKPDILLSKVSRYNQRGDYSQDGFDLLDDYVNGCSGAQALENLMKYVKKPLWQAWRNVIKTDLMRKFNFQFLSGLTSEDMHLIPQVYLQAQSVAVCNQPNYVYRIDRDGSIMNTESFKRYKDFFFIVKYWMNFFDKEDCPETLKPIFTQVIARTYFFYISRIYAFPKKERELLLEDGKQFKFLLKEQSLTKKNRFIYHLMGYRGTCWFYANRNGTIKQRKNTK